MESKYYVYAHCDYNFNPFYIGKGSGYRWKNGTTGRGKEWHKKTDELGGYRNRILMDNLNNSEAYELESFVIETIGLDSLVNEHSGSWNKGKTGVYSEEQLERYRASAKKRGNNRGKWKQ